MFGQLVHHTFTSFGGLQFAADILTDPPIEADQFRVDCPICPLLGGLNHIDDCGKGRLDWGRRFFMLHNACSFLKRLLHTEPPPTIFAKTTSVSFLNAGMSARIYSNALSGCGL
jgi:hypothetical protein